MKKLYVGCGPRPFHHQHEEVLADGGWTYIDRYVFEPDIENWDAGDLKVEDETVDKIYSSHLLEHIPHTQVETVLRHWYTKLKSGGKLIVNVPDLGWVAKQITRYESGLPLSGYFNEWTGEHGLLSIIYGSQSHDGEYHKSGFLDFQLENLLTSVGFKVLNIWKEIDAHDMQVILVEAEK